MWQILHWCDLRMHLRRQCELVVLVFSGTVKYRRSFQLQLIRVLRVKMERDVGWWIGLRP